jgi:2-dehydro-3-deoxygalactonokinase
MARRGAKCYMQATGFGLPDWIAIGPRLESTGVTATMACVLADWGTTNLRVWAVRPDRTIEGPRISKMGLLAVQGGRFGEALAEVCGDWLAGSKSAPVVMCGMVGSKLGWKEVPYLPTPVPLGDLGRHLCIIEAPFPGTVAIVPGVMMDDQTQPEVMRGEESQILGAMQALGIRNGVFLLPGTHSKWALIDHGNLVSFRTYMTGEVFGLIRRSGTLSQLMEGDAHDDAAFQRGVRFARSTDAGNLLHALFSVRTLGLLGRISREGLASYLSGLLIGAELSDGMAWLQARGISGLAAAIGTPAMLVAYQLAASVYELRMVALDSAAILPQALLSIATTAGMVTACAEDKT